jgi:hypothetical protein
MMITRFGSVVPRSIATALAMTVGLGTRGGDVTVSCTVTTSRQPPHSAPILRNSLSTQRRAAPIPRTSDVWSDSVWRVPNDTIFSI